MVINFLLFGVPLGFDFWQAHYLHGVIEWALWSGISSFQWWLWAGQIETYRAAKRYWAGLKRMGAADLETFRRARGF